MKSLSSTFRDRLQNGGTLAYFLRVQPRNGSVLGFTSYDSAITFSGVTFRPNNGIEPNAFSRGINSEVGSSEAQIIFDAAELSELQIIQGYLDLAEITWFIADWTQPPSNIDLVSDAECLILTRGRIGKISGNDLSFRGEVLTPEDRLSQSSQPVTQPRCRATLGDSLCQASVLSFVGSVTTPNGRLFSFAADIPTATAAQDNYCTNGRIVWLTGANVGARQKIIQQSAGSIALAQLPFRNIQAGDRFQAFGGCDKRHDGDCQNKFNNLVNFRGEPFVPGSDALIRNP